LVVGAGGTGSAILMGLPYLDQAMRVWGHPYGFQVSIMDADTVSETNCVRQPFSASDIGQNKATVLINRINMLWGTTWSTEMRVLAIRDAAARNRGITHTPEFVRFGVEHAEVLQ
jgi:PRTRC genetic system ThiF family protein